jgi:hypothetical protein
MEHCHGHSVSAKAAAKSRGISTRDLARRMRKRLNKTTEGIEAAVAKVKNNAETAIKELEAKRT